jgi:hypothetical protein
MKKLSLGLFAASALSLAISFVVYQTEVDFKARAVPATGIVKQTRAESYWISTGIAGAGRVETEQVSIVQFNALSGKVVTFSSSTYGALCKEKKVLVLYDPSNPDHARIDTEENPMNIAYAYLLFSLSLAVVAIVKLQRSDLRRK